MLDDYAARVLEGAVWVLEEGAAIAGIIVLLPTTNYLLLDNIAVSPARQGLGLGRRLLGCGSGNRRAQDGPGCYGCEDAARNWIRHGTFLFLELPGRQSSELAIHGLWQESAHEQSSKPRAIFALR